MIYDPGDPLNWANDLIRELVRAGERGVDVAMILEYRTHRGRLKENLGAYSCLKSHGVTVVLDDSSDTDHTKVVAIDGRVVYVGVAQLGRGRPVLQRGGLVRIVGEEVARIPEHHLLSST